MKILNDDTFLNAIETELNHQLDNKKGYDIIYTCGYKLWSYSTEISLNWDFFILQLIQAKSML